MSIGHMLLAVAMTFYVAIAMRYEERDLAARFGPAYDHWRALAGKRRSRSNPLFEWVKQRVRRYR